MPLTIIKIEVDRCANCPFNQQSQAKEHCVHPSGPHHPIPDLHLNPGSRGAPAWCPLRKEEVFVTWEGE